MRESLRRTADALRRALGRRDGRWAFALAAVGYPLVYLFAVGNLAVGGDGVGAAVVADPVGRAAEPVRPFVYEPVARVSLVVATLLFSPLNVVVGGVLGVLVGANAALSAVAVRAPSSCGIESSVGVATGGFALLSGATCCGPALLLVVGVQATAGLVAAFSAAIPLATGLLCVSLVAAGRTG
ncbi:MAG: hypothetical protein ABEJ78_11760 [Haloferacaceae archaeon]